MPGKWTRRNLMALWDGQPHTTDEEREVMRAECDRIFIALHRFQIKGKVEYRRVCGLHGGGGGVKSEKVREIYTDKVNKDLYSNHQNGVFPGDSYWPFPTRNNPYPSKVNMDDPNYVYLYAWCWHGKVGFMPWHRPYVAEYERGMQEYDPRYDDDRRFGEDAIGLPYWAWEGWDGLTMPMVLSSPTYIIKTNDFEDKGFEIGSTIRNPFYRWWAPVSLEDQVAEYFPSKFNNHNTTTRAAGYTHLGEEFSEQWPLLSHGKDLSIKHEVRVSMSCPVWEDISDIGSGVNIMNLEHTHNQVHTRVGGREKGGLRGQGTQCFEYPDVFKAKKDENGEEMKDENGETIKEKKKKSF